MTCVVVFCVDSVPARRNKAREARIILLVCLNYVKAVGCAAYNCII